MSDEQTLSEEQTTSEAAEVTPMTTTQCMNAVGAPGVSPFTGEPAASAKVKVLTPRCVQVDFTDEEGNSWAVQYTPTVAGLPSKFNNDDAVCLTEQLAKSEEAEEQ